MKDIYKKISEHYDIYNLDSDFKYKKIIIANNLISKAAKLVNKNSKIYDIGCGAGTTVKYILSNFKPENYIGVDISKESLKKAKKLGIKTIHGNITNLKIKNNSSDLTICTGVLMYSPDTQKAFKELTRITKKFIFLSVYNKNHIYYLLYNALSPLLKQINKSKLGKKFIKKIIFPLFYIGHIKLGVFLLTGKSTKMDKNIAFNVFNDQYMVPYQKFFTIQQVKSLSLENNLDIIEIRKEYKSKMISFIFKKGDNL